MRAGRLTKERVSERMSKLVACVCVLVFASLPLSRGEITLFAFVLLRKLFVQFIWVNLPLY